MKADSETIAAWLLGGIGVVAAIGTLWFGFQAKRDINTPPEDKVIPEASVPVIIPQSIYKPLAVLVLDVSGSMQSNDPNGQQAEAVKTFLRLYQTMVQDALRQGDTARVAVVLFATTAQQLDWSTTDGRSEPILTLPRQERELDDRVGAALMKFVEKRNGRDPREGAFTDTAAAVAEVQKILKEAGEIGPPCVVFATDGEDNPFPPLVNEYALKQQDMARQIVEQVNKRVRADYEDAPKTVQSAAEAGKRFLEAMEQKTARASASAPLWDPPRDYRRNLGKLQGYFDQAVKNLFPESAFKQNRQEQLFGSLGKLATRRFSAGVDGAELPLVWQFIYLGQGDEDLKSLNNFAASFHNSQDHWHLPQKVMHCQRASELQGSFMTVLGQWLNLESSPQNTDRFFVERNTGGIGLLVSAPQEVDTLLIRSPSGESLALTKGPSEQGRRTWFFAKSQPSSGEWRLQPGNKVLDGTLWARRHYRWGFRGLPQKFSVLAKLPPLSLAFFDTSTGKQETPGNVYSEASLPPQVRARLIHSSQTNVVVLSLQKDANGRISGYVGTLPSLATSSFGDMRLEAEFETLAYLDAGVTVPRQEARATWNVSPSVDIQLRNREGQQIKSLTSSKRLPGSRTKSASQP